MTDEMTPQSPGQTGGAAADVEMSQYVAGRSRVNEDKIRQDDEIISQFGEYEYGWHDSDAAGEAAKKGIDENVVRAISADKGEPEWMLDIRLKGYQAFLDKPMPDWGVDLSGFNADDFKYYVKPIDKQAATWEDLPDDIRNTYDRLGIPEAEKKRLVSGVAAQYESEVIYNSIQQELKDQGVIFVDTDTAVREYPDLVRKYFGTVVPPDDNKFGALNTAAWSGGSFIYVPKGVHVDIPLQAYFRINTPNMGQFERINTPNMGQFERTLIIADEGSYVHYVEGCTAPIYSTDSLHAAIVEIIVEKHARVRYTTVQNWSNNVYNLVTQRAYVREGGTMEWVDGNIGSKATMKWQHRLQGHDEVPGLHPGRTVRQGRNHVAGLRRQGAVPGYGRQDDPPGPAHQLHDRGQVHLARRRPVRLPRPGQDRQRRRRLLELHGLRRAAGRRLLALRHLSACGRARGRRVDGA